MCSSFAHSLGIYSVPFDAINFDISSAAYEPSESMVAGYEPPKPRIESEPSRAKMEIGPNSDLPPYHMQPMVVQGNIITTKADVPKRGIISQAQNQINPMLVDNRSRPGENPLEESTIVHKPTDKPINLDMNAFLGETQKTKKDIDIINDV